MKIKVLHINSNYIFTQLHQNMLEKLDDHCELVNQVFMAAYDKNMGIVTPNENVCVCECFKKRDRFFFNYKQNKISKALLKSFDIETFDIIHAYTLFTDGNCAYKIFQKYNIPYVVAIRNVDVNVFFAKMLHLRKRGIDIMRNAKAIFFLSHEYKRQVFDKFIPRRLYDELWKKSFILPNGIDDFWLNNKPSANHELNDVIKLVYAGRIDKNKNIPTIQQAMDILFKQGYNVELTVVGRVQDQAEYESILKNPKTKSMPAKPKEELIKIYRNADIL